MPKLSLAKLERHLYSAADRLRQEGDEFLDSEYKRLDKLQLLKSALMTDLLTGRVRVPADLGFG